MGNGEAKLGAGFGEGDISSIAGYGESAIGGATIGAGFGEGDTSSIAGIGEPAIGGATRKWRLL